MRIAIPLLFVILLGCQDTELPVTFPVVIADEVTVTNDGAVFFAHMINTPNAEKIINHGFVWSTSKAPTLSGHRIIIDGAPGETFSRTVIRDILAAKQFARAFVQTAKLTVYSNVVGFNGKGSRGPKFVSASPTEGFDGTEVTLTMSNFGYDSTYHVSLGGSIDCDIVSVVDSVIVFKTPPNDYLGRENIYLLHPGAKVFGGSFTILGPAIESIPLTAMPGEKIVLQAKYLDHADKLEVVFTDFNDFDTPVDFTVNSPTELEITVPDFPVETEGRIFLLSTKDGHTKTWFPPFPTTISN